MKTLPFGQDLLRDAVGAESLEQRVAHGTGGCSRYHLGDDIEAGVVVDAGADRDPIPLLRNTPPIMSI